MSKGDCLAELWIGGAYWQMIPWDGRSETVSVSLYINDKPTVTVFKFKLVEKLGKSWGKFIYEDVEKIIK